MDSSNIRVVLWDFDGVILNSNEVRDRGFEEVLKEFPNQEVEQLLSFHRENGGLSRYVKFRYFFEKIRNEAITEEEVMHWALRFSEIMLENLKDKSLLIGETVKFILENRQRYLMHIVSGSDQVELRELCKSLEIDHFFKSIHGSPTPKNDLVKNLLDEHHYASNSVILIGDSINDYEAAMVNDIAFQAFGNESLESKTTLKLF